MYIKYHEDDAECFREYTAVKASLDAEFEAEIPKMPTRSRSSLSLSSTRKFVILVGIS